VSSAFTRRSSLLASTCAAFALSGCMVGPNFEAPKPAVPAAYTNDAPPKSAYVSTDSVNPQWWTSFDDPTLTQLEAQAVAQNLDLQIATQRLMEAAAQAQITGAVLYPSLSGNASYEREGLSKTGIVAAFGSSGGAGIPIGGIPPFDVYQYGLGLQYDLDLWGKNRRAVEAAVANTRSAVESRRSALLNVQTQVASTYIQIRGAETLMAITQKNLDAANQLVQLTVERQQAGLTTSLDVANARATASSIQSQLPTLIAQRDAQIGQLGLLLGETPSGLPTDLVTAAPVPLTPPSVPVGLPSDLLQRRPDVRMATEDLHAATAEIGVAKAQFFPDISFAPTAALQSLQFKDLNQWTALTYTFGPTMTLPLFEGGQLTGQLKLRNAQQQEAALGYAKTVLTAFTQVNTALTTYTQEHATLDALNTDVQQANIALGLAEDQYKQGLTDYLTVLDAQQAYLAAQTNQAQSVTRMATDLVTLYQALGGGWEPVYPEQQGG